MYIKITILTLFKSKGKLTYATMLATLHDYNFIKAQSKAFILMIFYVEIICSGMGGGGGRGMLSHVTAEKSPYTVP